MKKLTEQKVLRDPIHGYVRIEDEIIWRLLACRELQRLRRIKQLGSTSMVYHTGTHSRFEHSLGVYEIARRMCNEVNGVRDLSEHDKTVLKCAALLHDLGHAPFSHSFETIMNVSHEEYTVQIIMGDSEIHDVLESYGENYAWEVAAVINHTHPNSVLSQLVSSQLDADRMDYLLRDSYFTGTSYGQFDLERILRTMRVREGKVVVKQTGMHTIEDYIMARYHMYWQVYYHPNARSYDILLRKVFARLADLYSQDHGIADEYPMYRALLSGKRFSNDDLYELDDSTCLYSFHLMMKGSDPVLADLARRILNRDLFAHSSLENRDRYYRLCIEKGFDPAYYFDCDHPSQGTYQPYKDNVNNSIWVLTDRDEIRELSKVSKVVEALSEIPAEQDEKVFYPREAAE